MVGQRNLILNRRNRKRGDCELGIKAHDELGRSCTRATSDHEEGSSCRGAGRSNRRDVMMQVQILLCFTGREPWVADWQLALPETPALIPDWGTIRPRRGRRTTAAIGRAIGRKPAGKA